MKPVLQALLLADHVYRDTTGKHIVVGTFNKMVFAKGGAEPKKIEIGGEEKGIVRDVQQAGNPYAYISLTEIHGKIQCVLRYVNLGQDKVFFETRFTLECSDPLQTVELAVPMLRLPHVAGIHALELLCDDEPIGSHRVIVEENKEDNDESNRESPD